MFKFLFLSLITLSLSSCLYRMPNDRNVATSPNTNNPNYTRERPTSFIPGQ